MIKTIMGILFILALPLYAVEMQKSIDYYSEKGIEVEFLELQDPLKIKLKLPDGETMYVEHIEKDFDALSALQKDKDNTAKKSVFLLKYTNKDGVQLYVPELKKHFKIIGTMEKHPIDIALQDCIGEYYSTAGMVECIILASDAWDAELNRAYKALGGSKNSTLKEAQIAWVKYRDAQKDAFVEEYSNRGGTIWRLILMHNIAELTKSQANVLKKMNSKSP